MTIPIDAIPWSLAARALVAGTLSVLVCAEASSQSVLYTLDGDLAWDSFGWSVSAAGDVNGDGFDDLIVGIPGADINGLNSGRAKVFSGADGSVLYVFDGDSAQDAFGNSVSAAGDVNTDGFDDLIVGAPEDDNNGLSSGSARVFSGVNGSVLYTFNGDSASDRFGFSVSGAGDVNGDGRPDLIVGARFDVNNGSQAGSARVFSGVDGSVLYTWYGDSAGDRFGHSVSGAGDVNGDGHHDLIVGAWGDDNNGPQSGTATVFSGLNGGIHYVLQGGTGDRFGQSVSGAGDVNNDGLDDLIVGAHLHDGNGTNSGGAVVLSIPNPGILIHIHNWAGDSPEDLFGQSVSGAGDVNGDGYSDLIVGAFWDDNAGPMSGSARVFSGVDGSVLYTFDGDWAGGELGYSVSAAGDVNGDGLDDLIVGAPLASNGAAPAGKAWVFASHGPLGVNFCSPAVPNSTGQPGVSRAFGLADVSANVVFLTADQLPNGELGYFLVSRTLGIFQPPGSQGLICIAGDIGRLNQPANLIVGPTDTIQVDLFNLPTNAPGSQQAMPGETLTFQCWFRDVGNTSNFTDAVSVTF